MSEREIFIAALQRDDPVDRRAFLDDACAQQPKLRGAVEELLRVYENAGSFLQHPAVDSAATGPFQQAAELTTLPERSGTVIGPYKLLEQIGEGGFGVVFMAEQTEPVRRKVALKVLKAGMDTRQVVARFEAERQALAIMDHPNIARMFDGGATATGRPFFVMELVRGVPITEYCDQNHRTPRERLELFATICHAVQHAHQKGLIHRDLKPSNVLVSRHDTTPIVKIIDFGVAKALGQSLTEKTLFTGIAQMIGTPMYMSPEQAGMSDLDVDTRSDIYSLGVLLYELLTGTTPFDKERLKSVGFDEMRRMIREHEPPRPSTRVSTLGAEALSTISQQRSTDPRRISATLRGELDWIVMKALEKDRSRRYESASALAADIQRYLSDEPVLACPPTTMYRFQKFARKHRPALATAAAIAACLILGTTVSAWQAVRATTAEAQANSNEQKANTNAARAEEKAQEATTQRDEAQRQRDEVKALADKLAAKEQQLQRNLYASNMNLAKSAWDAGGIERVQELLEQHRPKPGEPDLRGFEWHYLYRLCHSEIVTLKGHTAGIWSVAFSPDGKRLASGSLDNTVKVWDAQTGQELLTLKGLTDSFMGVAFSPDGQRLDSASGDKTVRVWDAQTGQELLNIKGHTTGVVSVAFSPDGKRLASGGKLAEGEPPFPGEVKVWDAQNGQELLTLKGPIGSVRSVAFSPDGKRLASAGGKWGRPSGEVNVWDSQTGQELLTIKGHAGLVNSVTFSPDGKRLASASGDRTVKVWDAETGQELFTFKEHANGVCSVGFSPDGKRLASASDDETVKVWDAQTGQELFNLKGHISNVWSVAFSPDGKRLASASNDKTVKVWDAQTGQKPLILKGHTKYLGRVAFSPDGQRLAGASGDKTVVWDARTGQELSTFKGHTGPVLSVAFSPDSKRLASSSEDKTVKVWDAQTGRELCTLTGPAHAVWSVAFSPDGKRLASPSKDNTVQVWDSETGQELFSIEHGSQVWYVAYSPDGKRLAGGGEELKLWDAQTGKELLTLAGHTDVRGLTPGMALEQVVFSPDSKHLASAADDKTVKVWDAVTGQELLSLKHIGEVWDVAFSPDGKRLASSTGTGQVQVWDAQTGQDLFTFQTHTHHGVSVAFSPDGHRLASVTSSADALVGEDNTKDSAVIIWNATPLPEKP